MKQFFKSIVLLATVSFSSMASVSAENLVIRKLNSDKVVSAFWKMKELYEEIKVEDAKIKQENVSKQKEITAQNDEILKMAKQLQDPKLPRGERQSLESQYKRKFDRLKHTKKLHDDHIQIKARALQTQLETERTVLLKQIREVVLDYAAKNGIDAIYDEKQLVFMKDKYDISDEIIELINTDAPEDKTSEDGDE